MRSMIVGRLFAGVLAASFMASPLLAADGRPYLGVGADATAKEDGGAGVLLREVDPAGPAGKAGLRQGDRIDKVGDREVKTFEDLKNAVADHKPGDVLPIELMRDGKAVTISVTLSEKAESLGLVLPPVQEHGAYLGVHAQALTAEMKDRLGVSVEKGVVVAQVMPNSPAAQVGLQENDVITHVGTAAVAGPEELHNALQNMGAGKEVTLKLVRGKQEMELKAHLQEAPAAALPDGIGDLPQGVEQFSGSLPDFFHGLEKTSQLEKKVQELEKRVKDLEKKLAK
jgi:S1-C subfamily serine protease